jgi:hypothetical protein
MPGSAIQEPKDATSGTREICLVKDHLIFCSQKKNLKKVHLIGGERLNLHCMTVPALDC